MSRIRNGPALWSESGIKLEICVLSGSSSVLFHNQENEMARDRNEDIRSQFPCAVLGKANSVQSFCKDRLLVTL